MVHKPGHLQFDDSSSGKQKPGTPRAVDFGDNGAETRTGAGLAAPVQKSPAQRMPSAVFDEGGGDIAPAMAYARTAFAELARAHEHSLERKIRQLSPWKHEVVNGWGGKALQENAAITTQTARIISKFAECRIGELIEKATLMARRGESGLLNRIFLRSKVISFKPSLSVARSQLATFSLECNTNIAGLDELGVRLRLDLAALSSAYEALPKPGEQTLESSIHSRRVLLQQSIHQAELTSLQLHELKQQIAMQSAGVEQLLMITIPAFEMSDAAR